MYLIPPAPLHFLVFSFLSSLFCLWLLKQLVMRNPDHADSGVAAHEMTIFKDLLSGSFEDIKDTLKIVSKTVMPVEEIRQMFPEDFIESGTFVLYFWY
jgi:hypothetical protein